MKFISPLHRDQYHDKRVADAIRLLERKDMMEIFDQTSAQNFTCRFTKEFLRETIYQMVKYKSVKKDLHNETEKFVQKQPALLSGSAEVKTEKLLTHMLLA